MALLVPKRRGATPAHRYAPGQERRAAALIGGQVTPGSGSGHQRMDARRRRLVRLECKSTTKKSFSLTRDLARQIQEAVLGADEVPVVQLDFIDQRGKLLDRLYVMPGWAAEDLLAGYTDAP